MLIWLIWWLNQRECESIGEELPKEFPRYLRSQYSSRYGRAGRGRLWADAQFGDVAVEPWPSTPLAKFLGAYSGGIVIRPAEHIWVEDYPGIGAR
jgi:hypothetical protein